MSRARIIFIDGHRHRQSSGYGEFARGILLSLLQTADFEVAILPGAPEFDDIGLQRDLLSRIRVVANPAEGDLVFQFGQPGKRTRYARPTVLYTMFDTSRLEAEKLAALVDHDPDLVLVPNQYNKRFLDPHVRDVRVVPPRLDTNLFKPRLRSRSESREFTFIFQGGFGFRKGVDLLLEAFLAEFRRGEARLHLHCPGMTMTHANHVLRALAGRITPPVIEIFDKSYSREWMANFYNGSDGFASLTRAEAWGLPISEAILCGRPVVTSRDWAMAEYLPADYAYFVAGERQPLERNQNPFGSAWCLTHGAPGNEFFEPLIADARAKLRAVVDDPDRAKRHAEHARAHLIKAFHPQRVQEILERALRDLLAGPKPASAGDILDAGSRGS